MDADKNGLIDFQEFVFYVSKKEEECRKVFGDVDTNHDGEWQMSELSAALNNLEMSYTNKQLRDMVHKLDTVWNHHKAQLYTKLFNQYLNTDSSIVKKFTVY